MNEKKEARARASYEARTGRDDWEDVRKLGPIGRVKAMLKGSPIEGPCELHIEQNLSKAGGFGTTDLMRWHWWLTDAHGRVVHSDYQFTMKMCDQVARRWAAKHGTEING